MRREFFRVANIVSEPGAPKMDKIAQARANLLSAPDERKKHLELVRALQPLGATDELREVIAKWSARDPLDDGAIVARADLLARSGERDGALRVLSGAGGDFPGLARAFERAGRASEACALRIAAAELTPDDADAVANAVRCERAAGRHDAADRWLSATKSRAAVERVLAATPSKDNVAFGDIVVDATWDQPADLDLAIVDPSGQRMSWLSRGKSVRAADCTSQTHETIALSNFNAGTFVIEVVRAGGLEGTVTGKLRVTSQGQVRLIPFVLHGKRAQPARVDVHYESRLVPM
jgi:hypothetical protein